MKRELEHFKIGESYGGNQNWFRSVMMRLGGCGAETACDSSIYFARRFGLTKLYPFDPWIVKKEEYVDFAHRMERYLWPRMTGIDRLDIFIEGFRRFTGDTGEQRIELTPFEGSESFENAAAFVKKQIDSGYPVPTLILNHKNRKLKNYVWHWFLINGYDGDGDAIRVKAVTFGGFEWLLLKELWDTGHRRRGGFVRFEVKGMS